MKIYLKSNGFFKKHKFGVFAFNLHTQLYMTISCARKGGYGPYGPTTVGSMDRMNVYFVPYPTGGRRCM